MRKINGFYIAIILLIPALIWLLKPEEQNEVAFYGFAENLETEINYNYDVVVDKIMVRPGQQVIEGSPLMKISRRKSKEVMDDQSFQISTLMAEEKEWKSKKLNDLKSMELEKEIKENALNNQIRDLKKELNYKQSLIKKMELGDSSSIYQPLRDELLQVQSELIKTGESYDLKLSALRDEIAVGSKPFRSRINELEAERSFDEEHKVQFIDVTAPEEGLIGNIYCKEAEHVPAFKTLLTFYEPHSGLIKGYVHEDLLMKVELDDAFEVSSLKDETIMYEGKVIGLGSRIVEIPDRMRKFPNVKTYGREVTIEITKENIFLQKEKVSLRRKTSVQ